MNKFDYIVVGQGIAGTLLHFELTKLNKKVLCIDNFLENSASMVAAGMYNPIVFKRITKSWEVDTLLPYAKKTYQELEQFLNKKLNNQIDIIRFFSSIEQQNNWLVKSAEKGFENYLSNEKKEITKSSKISCEYGYGTVKKGGWINVKALIHNYRNCLINNDLYLEEKFDYNALKVNENNVKYKNSICAKHIIFCEGTNVINNPFFNYLPLKPTKGEVLTIEIENFNSVDLLNKGFFILPIGDNKYRVGATYSWDKLDWLPTNEGKTELEEKIKTIIKVPYKVIEHKAGIRPTVKDRRPLIGEHPEYKNLFVFNGLGTKGVMIAPYYANEFAKKITLKKTTISAEVNINRF